MNSFQTRTGSAKGLRHLANEFGQATLSSYGAQLLSWTPDGQAPVVWHPAAVSVVQGKATRGGVPVIFPWFGAGFSESRSADKRPKHGFGRLSVWKEDLSVPRSEREMTFILDSEGMGATETGADWLSQMEAEGRPQFRATLHVEVTEVLRTSLRVENVGESAFTFEEALHTYLHVGSTSSAELEGLEGARYLDATRAGMPVVVQGQEPLRFEGPIDRIYSSSSDVTLRDSQLNRSIEISAEGSARTVVWNPGEEAGNAMGDMAAGEWDSFVCVETANCRENAVTLDPGQSHTLSQTLAVAAFRSELQQ